MTKPVRAIIMRTTKGTDQPAQLSLISLFVIHCLNSIIIDVIPKISRLNFCTEQMDLSLTW